MDHPIGICEISEEQKRPLALRYDFEHLRKGTVYIRRGSSTDAATPEEIHQIVLFDQQGKIKENAKTRFTEQYREFMKIPDGTIKKIQQKGHYLISVHPETSKTELIPTDDLESTVRDATIRTDYWQYPEVDYGEWSNGPDYTEAKFEIVDYTQFWRFYTNGHFLHYIGFYDDWRRLDRSDFDETYGEIEQIQPPTETLNIRNIARILTLLYTFIYKLYDILHIHEKIVISIELKNTKGRKIEGTHLRIPFAPCKLNSIPLKREVKFKKTKDSLDDYASKDFCSILRMFNVPNYKSNTYKQFIQEEFDSIDRTNWRQLLP